MTINKIRSKDEQFEAEKDRAELLNKLGIVEILKEEIITEIVEKPKVKKTRRAKLNVK